MSFDSESSFFEMLLEGLGLLAVLALALLGLLVVLLVTGVLLALLGLLLRQRGLTVAGTALAAGSGAFYLYVTTYAG